MVIVANSTITYVRPLIIANKQIITRLIEKNTNFLLISFVISFDNTVDGECFVFNETIFNMGWCCIVALLKLF
tara:strand:- start:135 stop:353 length:219 start_codon:yes stop_codon:yes gene_type:complete